MPDDIGAFLSGIESAMKTQRKQQKSDDIIGFIRENWKLFARSRQEMERLYQQLGTTADYSVDGLCDLLGLPEYVFFKRYKAADIGREVLAFPSSGLMQLYVKCRNSSRNGAVCVFAVAGKSTVCVTNLQTEVQPGMLLISYTPEDDDRPVHIFRASEAAVRLPNLFGEKFN